MTATATGPWLPGITAILAFVFAIALLDQWRERHRGFQLAWAVGMTLFGIGSGAEALAGAWVSLLARRGPVLSAACRERIACSVRPRARRPTPGRSRRRSRTRSSSHAQPLTARCIPRASQSSASQPSSETEIPQR